MRELKVGDEVKLSLNSPWNTGSSDNPLETYGTVISIFLETHLTTRVRWSNGETNSYRAVDLILQLKESRV